jgi:rhodanese-related sulfurtransferase
MKKWVLLAALGILVVFIGCTTIQRAQSVPRISKDELKAKLGSPDIILIDVRAKNDWEKSDEKITGAVRMDPAAVDVWAGTLPKDKEIILYCA